MDTFLVLYFLAGLVTATLVHLDVFGKSNFKDVLFMAILWPLLPVTGVIGPILKEGRMRRVVCAANRSENGDIVLGARHHDKLMNEAIRSAGLQGTKWEQGFIDQWGEFMSREEAWKVAELAGQILRRVGGDSKGVLYSENLY